MILLGWSKGIFRFEHCRIRFRFLPLQRFPQRIRGQRRVQLGNLQRLHARLEARHAFGLHDDVRDRFYSLEGEVGWCFQSECVG